MSSWLVLTRRIHLLIRFIILRKSVSEMSDAKRRKKAYFVQAGKSKKSQLFFTLDAGMKGFLITCNNAEKKAVQEAYSLFNEYADKMYGRERDEKSDHSGEDDFESAIREEVEAMKKQAAGARRFQVVDSKTTNCVFIKTTLEQPGELVTKIFTDLLESQKPKSRFILKLHPVSGTCRADVGKIEKLAEEILTPALADAEVTTFCVMYKARCNNSMDRDVIIELVARVAASINPSIKVKIDDPDLVVTVDILQKICCIGVLKNYNKFKKYNVQEVVGLGQAQKTAAGTKDSAENTAAETSERNDSESGDVAESKDSKELKDVPDSETSPSKLERPSDSVMLKADTSSSDASKGCPPSTKAADSKDSEELQDSPDAKTLESKSELPSESPKLEADASCPDAKGGCPSTE